MINPINNSNINEWGHLKAAKSLPNSVAREERSPVAKDVVTLDAAYSRELNRYSPEKVSSYEDALALVAAITRDVYSSPEVLSTLHSPLSPFEVQSFYR